MAPAGNKAKRLSSVSYTTKTIHHHHHHHHHSTQKQQTFYKTCCKHKKTLCNIKLGLTFQRLKTLKIGELVLTANSHGQLVLTANFPSLRDLTVWRVTANG